MIPDDLSLSKKEIMLNNNSIIFRPIEEKDNMELAILIRSIFEEYNAPKTGSVYDDEQTDNLYQAFIGINAEYWVVESEHKIVGGCGFYPTKGLPESCAEIVKFYFDSQLRGKGIGSRLLKMIEQKAFKAGYKQLYIESFGHFKEAVYLYEKQGYKKLDSPMGASGHHATTIHLLKNLSDHE